MHVCFSRFLNEVEDFAPFHDDRSFFSRVGGCGEQERCDAVLPQVRVPQFVKVDLVEEHVSVHDEKVFADLAGYELQAVCAAAALFFFNVVNARSEVAPVLDDFERFRENFLSCNDVDGGESVFPQCSEHVLDDCAVSDACGEPVVSSDVQFALFPSAQDDRALLLTERVLREKFNRLAAVSYRDVVNDAVDIFQDVLIDCHADFGLHAAIVIVTYI